jgi:hypothetical protein
MVLIHAQEEGTSRIQEFQSQKGILIIKEFFEIGMVKGQYGSDLEFSILRLTNPNGNVSLKGLKLSSSKRGSYSTDEQSALLDEEEVDALITALQYMVQIQNEKGSDKNMPYTEYIFRAKDGFEIGFMVNKGEYTAFSSVGRIGAISAFFKYADLGAILSKAQEAKSKLMSL